MTGRRAEAGAGILTVPPFWRGRDGSRTPAGRDQVRRRIKVKDNARGASHAPAASRASAGRPRAKAGGEGRIKFQDDDVSRHKSVDTLRGYVRDGSRLTAKRENADCYPFRASAARAHLSSCSSVEAPLTPIAPTSRPD